MDQLSLTETKQKATMTFKKGETPKGAIVFQKGVSGNKNGRPPKLPDLKELLAIVLSEEKDGKPAMERILRTYARNAEKGDTKAGDILMLWGYGKPKETLDVTSGGKMITPIINVLKLKD